MFDDTSGNDGNQFTEAFSKASGYTPAAMRLYMMWKGELTRYTQKPGSSEDELDRVFARLKREAKWNDDAGAIGGVPKGEKVRAPASSPQASGKAITAMPQGPSGVASPTRPASVPGRDLTIQGEVARQVAQSVLDSFKVRDGRSIGDVRFGELDSLAFTNEMEAALVRQIKLHARASHDSKVRDVVKDREMKQFIANAERQARKIQENGNV